MRSKNIIIQPGNDLERKLLLLCVHSLSTQEESESMQELLHQNIDWSLFYQLIVKNRVEALVYKYLQNKFCTEPIVFKKLEEDYKKNQFRAILLTMELLQIMERFKENQIAALSVKGPLLSALIYGDISLRTSRDLDILISQTDMIQANQLLLNMGFELDDSIKNLTPRQQEHIKKNFHHFVYHNQNGLELELHWRLSSDYYDIPFGKLWNEKQKYILFGRYVNTLNREENLAYLIVHGSKHAWKRVRWLCDVYEILSLESFDEQSFIHRCESLGILHMVRQTLILCKELFGGDYDIPIKLSMKEEGISQRLAVIALNFIYSQEEEPELYGASLFKEYKQYMLLWYRGYGRKLRYFRRHFIPTVEDFQSIKLRDQFFILYSILRVIKIINRCAELGLKKLKLVKGSRGGHHE